MKPLKNKIGAAISVIYFFLKIKRVRFISKWLPGAIGFICHDAISPKKLKGQKSLNKTKNYAQLSSRNTYNRPSMDVHYSLEPTKQISHFI